MAKQINEREIILAVLMEVTENGMYSHIILRDVLAKYQYLDKKERAFITRVTEGTLEHMIEIDYILNQFSKVKVKKMKPVIRNILRSAVYQLKYMYSVPDHAVCSEAVKLAVRKGFSGLKGYVNGVLRSIARGLDDVKYPTEEVAALSVKYSIPEWIIRMWKKAYGEETVKKMAADFLKEKPVTIRCCQEKITPKELKKRLESEGVRVTAHPYLPYAFTITGFDYLDGLESFQNGLFAVQDISSMLVGELASPQAGDQIVDVCAAPGGKALHVAEKLWIAEQEKAKAEQQSEHEMNPDGQKVRTDSENGAEERAEGLKSDEASVQPNGRVEARDLTEYKVELMWDNISRFGLKNIVAVCRDATMPDEEWKEKADLVIADLPCSGLGVLGRKPDLKYRIQEQDLHDLAKLQRQILENVQGMVKIGGTLLYSTCTVNPEENIENVHWFLKEHPEFCLDDIQKDLCPELKESVEEQGCLQLLPGVHQCDGFFIARMKRKK